LNSQAGEHCRDVPSEVAGIHIFREIPRRTGEVDEIAKAVQGYAAQTATMIPLANSIAFSLTPAAAPACRSGPLLKSNTRHIRHQRQRRNLHCAEGAAAAAGRRHHSLECFHRRIEGYGSFQRLCRFKGRSAQPGPRVLASDQSSFVNAAELVVDGGMTQV